MMPVPRKVVLVLLLILGTVSSVSAAEWADKMFEVKKHDFGRVPFGAQAEHEFVLNNVNAFEVEILRTRVSCECTEPKISKRVIAPGEQATIVAGLNTKKYNGRKGATITVTFSRPSYAEVQLHVTSYIDKQFSITPGSVELGSIEQGTEVQKEVTVAYTGNPYWRILQVRSNNPLLSGEVTQIERTGEQVSYRLRVRLSPEAPGGYLKDHIVLVTNDSQSSEVPVLVESQVLSVITVSPTVLLMGVVGPGKQVTKNLVVRGKHPFRIVSATCDAEGYSLGEVAAVAPKTLFLVPVTFTAGTRPGKASGRIQIKTDASQTTCEVPVQVVVE